MRATTILIAITLLAASCVSRKPSGYAKTFRSACVSMDEKSWQTAVKSWQTLLKVDPNNQNLNYKLGQCYYNLGLDSLAIPALSKACAGKFSKSYDPYDYAENKASVEAKLLLAESYSRIGLLSSSEREMRELSEYLPEKHRAQTDIKREIDRIEVAKDLMSAESGISVYPLPWSDAYAPTVSIDGSVMYMGLKGSGSSFVAVSNRNPDGSWSTPSMFPGTFDGEMPAYMTPDGTALWTVRENTAYSVSANSHTIEPYDAERLAMSGDTKYVSRDGEIYVISEGKETPFKYNTKWDDMVAGISIDGKVLYVSSDRPGTMGMHDLFSVDVMTGEALNLGYPVNSTRDDLWYSVSGGGVAYMSSDRGGRWRIYKCVGGRASNEKVIRGFVTVVGKNKEVRIKSANFDVVTADGSFLYVTADCGPVVFQYEIDGIKAGLDTVNVPCDEGYAESIFETYLMPYAPKQIEPKQIEHTLPLAESKLAQTQKKLSVPPSPKDNMPEWFTDTEYDPSRPVQFQFDSSGVAIFERYFTYGGQEFSSAESRFAQFVAAVASLADRGIVEISIEASASRVPSRRFANNDALAANRAFAARDQISAALEVLGYVEDVDFCFVSVTHEVGGKEYKNDAQKSKEAYERHQFVKIRSKLVK